MHIVTKTSLFQVNYRREPKIGCDIRKKDKEFVRKIKNRHEKAKSALIKSQEKIKRQADRNRKEVDEYKAGDKVLISMKDFSMELMKRVMKKLTEKFIGPYVVKKIMSENVVELELPVSLRIHLIVNVGRIVRKFDDDGTREDWELQEIKR